MSFYIINLDRRDDRYQSLKKQITEIPNNDCIFNRYSAVDGSNLKITPEYCYLMRNNTYKQRRSVFGTAMSHIRLYQQLLKDSNHDYYVIFEDDINFCPSFARKWKETEIKLNNNKNKDNFDICFIGYMVSPPLENKPKYNSAQNPIKIDKITNNNYYSGLFGYVISKKGAKFILEIVRKHGVNYPIDTMVLYMMVHRYGKNFRAICTVPRLVFTQVATKNNKVDSDIQRDFQRLCYDLRIITSDAKIVELYPDIIDKINASPNKIFQKVDQIPEGIQSDVVFISTIATPTQIPRLKYKCPIIYLISDPKVVQLETLPTDPHFLCTTIQIQNAIKHNRKSNFNQNIILNIENYYFNYWKKHYQSKQPK